MLDRLPTNLAYTKNRTEYAGYDVMWTDYDATIELYGKTRTIASVTVYPDGHILVLKSTSVGLSGERACWNNLVRHLGGIPKPGEVLYCTKWGETA